MQLFQTVKAQASALALLLRLEYDWEQARRNASFSHS